MLEDVLTDGQLDPCAMCGRILGRERFSLNQAVESIDGDDSIGVQSAERIVGACSPKCADLARLELLRDLAIREIPDLKVVCCAGCLTPIFRRQRHLAFTWSREIEVSDQILQPIGEGILAAFCDQLECRDKAAAAKKRLIYRYCAWWDAQDRFLGSRQVPDDAG